LKIIIIRDESFPLVKCLKIEFQIYSKQLEHESVGMQIQGVSLLFWSLHFCNLHDSANPRCTSLSPIWHGFAPGFVNYKKSALDSQTQVIVYQLLAHGRWFSRGTLASSTNKTGHHDIAEILMKVALSAKNQINPF
jgi:hypothetical protein